MLHGKAHQADQVGQQAALAGAFHLGFVQRGIGLPQLTFVDQVRRRVQRVGQGFDVAVGQRGAAGAVVQNLQRGNFVFVLGNELFKALHQTLGALTDGFAKACVQQRVLRHHVHHQVGLLAQLQDQGAQRGVGKGFGGFHLFGLGLKGRCVVIHVQRLHNAAGHVAQAFAAAGFQHFGVVGGAQVFVQPGQAGGHAAQHFVFYIAQAHGLQQFVQGHGFLRVHGAAVGFVALTHAHGVHDHKVVFHPGVRRHGLQVGAVAHAHATAFHLLKEAAAFHAAHEHHNLDRLDVGAGGDHVHRHSHTRKVAIAKRADQVLRLGACGSVGDLLRKLVALAKFFAQDFHNFFGVVIVFGKDQRLGHLGAAREDVGMQPVAKGGDDFANLVGRLHAAVQLVGVVFKVFVELPSAFAAGGFVYRLQPKALLYFCTLFRHLGLDSVHVVIDVHPIGHGLGVAVFHDQVLVEEAKGLFVGRGGQTHQIGVVILQHLPPQVVDAAVRFVGDHDVKQLDGKCRVVANGLGVFEQALCTLCAFFVGLGRQLFAFEQTEHALDGADDHTGAGVHLVALQVLHDELFAKLVTVVGAGVLFKFFLGLPGQIAPVHQKQHAPRTTKLDEAVNEADGGEGFAAARGHLDEGFGFVGGQAFL